ncbi:MAG: 30S ribosomal protein S17 [Candidatus Terrybacteria bacterium RIFCSPHIGHO2_01_FULL_48_17]|uniref:Small ribosomal subunit protein uS17 n=1 Tax=Candidatus Terrybacteria bacterium RIFCSPHIGHO2_01_FULL_48_17 TaxID=1802362 RepID=A0A1G2PKT3_9BACT|nr:MAG: 30S ribosomal protein S17 [Candidatus Terrybacteria bacterium RIFCSPHIGHO2_01_FULL_48_17]OHA52836.1 MAG: 30S ribosomal protein S17 [Candidatus Terrybacteria bacterium RIFCSPLOWO2_01_FULL_48_14]
MNNTTLRTRKLTGIVASTKMSKTVSVRVEHIKKLVKLQRFVKRHRKFLAHDELGVHEGDLVQIQETRPVSRHKRWKVVKIISSIHKSGESENA